MTSLYRHFDRDGRLLYVGISNNALARLRGHKLDASWYPEITDISIAHYPDRATAERAEARAIRTEAPLYNVRIPPAQPIPEIVLEATRRVTVRPVPYEKPRRMGYVYAEHHLIAGYATALARLGVPADLIFVDDERSQPNLIRALKTAQHEGTVFFASDISDEYGALLRSRGVRVKRVRPVEEVGKAQNRAQAAASKARRRTRSK